MDKKVKKFNPIECGFLEKKDKDGEVEYVYIDDNQVIGKLVYIYGDWIACKVVHCVSGSTNEHEVFVGKIRTNDFAIELVKSIFY